MLKVQTFKEFDYRELENDINNFLDEETVILEDVKYQVFVTEDDWGTYDEKHYALVIYKYVGL